MMNKRKYYPVTLGVMLLAGASGVSAQNTIEQGLYVTPSAGYYMFDSDNDNQTDDAPLYGLTLGYQINKYFGVEGSYFRLDSEVTPKDERRYIKDDKGNYILNSTGRLTTVGQFGGKFSDQKVANSHTYYAEGDDVSVDVYGVNLVFSLGISGPVSPYLAVGYTRLDSDTELSESNDDMMDVALGAKYFVTPNVYVQGDVRALHSWDNEDTDYSAGLGVGYLIGTPATAAPVVDKAPPPEETPAPVETDSDNDGVPDSRDKCPNTPAGEQVDADGCPVGLPGGQKEVSITLEVLFDTNKAVVKPQYLPNVEKLAQFMRDYPNTSADIEGHTDSKGTNDLNKRLSQRRADSVRETLISQFGIDANRLRAVGYGEERPIADNNTAAGRQQNRRVVAVITAVVPTGGTQ
jgi:OOP family OmpA-OmpF porin